MMIQLDKELAEIFEILGLTKDDVDAGQVLRVATVCFQCFDKGFSTGTERAIHTVQRMAVNPQPIVKEIRKPVR